MEPAEYYAKERRARWSRAINAATFLDMLESGASLEIVIRDKEFRGNSLCGLVEASEEGEKAELHRICRGIALRLVQEVLKEKV